MWGGSNVIYAVGFGKESLIGLLSMSSMVHVESVFFMARRGGEIGDDGSDMGLLLIRVGESNVSGGVGFVEVYVGAVFVGCKLGFINMSVLFLPCMLLGVR